MLLNLTSVSRLAGLSLFLLLACKKEAPEVDSTNIRLFTNGAEVTDISTKQQFLTRHTVAFQPVAAGPTDKVTFVAADTARFSFSARRYSVVKNGTSYLFYSPYMVQLSDNNMLLHTMCKYTGQLAIAPCAGGGFTGCYLAQEVYVGTAEAKQLTLPSLQYYWSVNQRPGASAYTQRQWATTFNEFNEAVIAKVPQNDTLAIRTGRVSILMQ